MQAGHPREIPNLSARKIRKCPAADQDVLKMTSGKLEAVASGPIPNSIGARDNAETSERRAERASSRRR
ncbi:protein of unknown function [Paraburkholderia kururiensis]